MKCHQAKDALSALVSGDLASPQREDVEAHLHSCSACRAEFEELQNVWQELGELTAYQAPRELQPGLEALSAKSPRNLMPPLSGSPRRQVLLHAIAALLLLAAGITIGYSLQPAEQKSRFLLLLREVEILELTDSQQEELVLEYASWYRSLVARGLGLQGERLQKGRQLLVRSNGGVTMYGQQIFSDEDVPVSGFFLIQADSLAEALGIATTCPHLRVGTIEVRELYPE